MSKKDTKNRTVQMTIVEDNEVVQVPSKTPADEEPAWVTYELKRTLKLAEYESLSLRVGITVPCRKKEIQQTYEEARKFVEKRIKERLIKWGFKK